MSKEDLFREVDEDLERQKLEALWKRYGTYVVAAILAVVIGTGGNSYIQSSKIAAQQKSTGELITLLSTKNDQDKKISDLLAFSEDNKGQSPATMAAFHAASMALKANKKDQAIKIYDSIAANEKAEHEFRQLAELLSVQQQMETGDVGQLQQKLQPLMAANEPWRFSAMELSGYIAVRAGDKAKAKELFTNLTQDASVPQSLSARAADVLRLLAE